MSISTTPTKTRVKSHHPHPPSSNQPHNQYPPHSPPLYEESNGNAITATTKSSPKNPNNPKTHNNPDQRHHQQDEQSHNNHHSRSNSSRVHNNHHHNYNSHHPSDNRQQPLQSYSSPPHENGNRNGYYHQNGNANPQIPNGIPMQSNKKGEYGNNAHEDIGNGYYSPKKELTAVNDKGNTWFINNNQGDGHHHPHYPGDNTMGSTIPVVPLLSPKHPINNDFHRNNGLLQNGIGGGAIQQNHLQNNIPLPNQLEQLPNQISPISTPATDHLHDSHHQKAQKNGYHHQHPQHLTQNHHHHTKRNNFVGCHDQRLHHQQMEEDLLNMGRIQELRDRMGENRTKINERALWKCLGAEFLGTSLLLFLGIGCVLKMEHETTKGLSFLGIALCWGFTVATIAQALGGISADLNPAITLSCMVTGKIPVVKAVMYILMQCLGALAGTSLLKAVTPDNIEGNWGITQLAPGVTPIQGCVIEIISTFVLTFTVFSVTDENRKDIKGSVPLAVGLCVAAIVMCSGPLTGASLNPARTLGPSIVAGNFDDHWIYWVGPILGGLLAGLIYTHVFRQLRPEEIEALEADEQLRQREREAKDSVGSPTV